ncbi:hypothetical protein ACOMHN_014800 [Nucella lapillus]
MGVGNARSVEETLQWGVGRLASRLPLRWLEGSRCLEAVVRGRIFVVHVRGRLVCLCCLVLSTVLGL